MQVFRFEDDFDLVKTLEFRVYESIRACKCSQDQYTDGYEFIRNFQHMRDISNKYKLDPEDTRQIMISVPVKWSDSDVPTLSLVACINECNIEKFREEFNKIDMPIHMTVMSETK